MAITDLTTRQGTQESLDIERDRLSAMEDGTWPRDLNESLRYLNCPNNESYTDYSKRITLNQIKYLEERLIRFDLKEQIHTRALVIMDRLQRLSDRDDSFDLIYTPDDVREVIAEAREIYGLLKEDGSLKVLAELGDLINSLD